MALKIGIEVKGNLPVTFPQFKRMIRKTVIEDGMEVPLNESLEDLKIELKDLINNEIKNTSKDATSNTVTEHNINLPIGDSEILKHLTNIDTTTVNTNKDYTNLSEGGFIVIRDKRAIIRMPITDSQTPEEVFSKASALFSKSIFCEKLGPSVKYYLPKEDFDITKWVKVYCSTDTGMTDKSKKRMESFKEKGYIEFRLKQAGVDEMTKNAIDMNPLMEEIKAGNYEKAEQMTNNIRTLDKSLNIEQKVIDLADKRAVVPEIDTLNKLNELITNLRIKKKITQKGSEYSLESNYSDDPSKVFENAIEEIKRNIEIWKATNYNIWTRKLSEVVIRVLQHLASGESSYERSNI